ncbi:MAG TPA: hypothetical protein QGG47_13055 [Acidobacteriota bacterium]|nr:hypothetical protein [Acidobacteriota bacterium]
MSFPRIALLVVLCVVAACAPEPASEPEPTPATAPMDDASAIDAVRVTNVRHDGGDM